MIRSALSRVRRVESNRKTRPVAHRPLFEALEGRQMLAAPGAPVPLAPPVPLLNAATVPQFVNDITALDPLAYKYDSLVNPLTGLPANTFRVAAQSIQVDVGLGLKDVNGNPIKTNMFGYTDANPDSPVPNLTAAGVYYGKTFEVTQGQPIAVTWINNLPAQHVVNVDPTLLDQMPGMGGMGMVYDPLTNSIAGGVPISTHLHGGHTDAVYDGTPEQWWNSTSTGMDYVDTTAANPSQLPNTFTYRNDQQAANLWYHDHAMGVTRLNAYAGMAGFYIIRNADDTGLANNPAGLPAGAYEMGLAIQDTQFLSDGLLRDDAMAQTYTDPVSGNTGTVASTLPEEFGDVILVNGKAWPKMNVEAKRYRFRLINGSDSRFYTMTVQNPATLGTVPIWQVGTDDGLLNKPVKLATLTIAPGERADFVIDFTKYKPGTRFVLTNSAPTPFPAGAKPVAGLTDRLMAFDVIAPVGPDLSKPMSTTNVLNTINPVPAPAIVTPTRQMALYETLDSYGRITPLLGTPATSAEFMDPATELPLVGSTEVWEIYNNTADTHPIHLHQVSYQVLTRRTFSTKLINLGLSPSGSTTMWGMDPIRTKYTSAPVLAVGNEVAWKDTIQINPGEVITVRAKFDLPGKYVTHCHILAHEEHDMMRYMIVLNNATDNPMSPAVQFPAPGMVVDVLGQKVDPVTGSILPVVLG